MTKDELIHHIEECIDRAEESKHDAECDSYNHAFSYGYLVAAKHILEKLKLEVNE
jgi:hypothetical protein